MFKKAIGFKIQKVKSLEKTLSAQLDLDLKTIFSDLVEALQLVSENLPLDIFKNQVDEFCDSLLTVQSMFLSEKKGLTTKIENLKMEYLKSNQPDCALASLEVSKNELRKIIENKKNEIQEFRNKISVLKKENKRSSTQLVNEAQRYLLVDILKPDQVKIISPVPHNLFVLKSISNNEVGVGVNISMNTLRLELYKKQYLSKMKPLAKASVKYLSEKVEFNKTQKAELVEFCLDFFIYFLRAHILNSQKEDIVEIFLRRVEDTKEFKTLPEYVNKERALKECKKNMLHSIHELLNEYELDFEGCNRKLFEYILEIHSLKTETQVHQIAATIINNQIEIPDLEKRLDEIDAVIKKSQRSQTLQEMIRPVEKELENLNDKYLQLFVEKVSKFCEKLFSLSDQKENENKLLANIVNAEDLRTEQFYLVNNNDKLIYLAFSPEFLTQLKTHFRKVEQEMILASLKKGEIAMPLKIKLNDDNSILLNITNLKNSPRTEYLVIWINEN